MRRIVPLLVASALVLGACGDDTVDPGSAGSTVPPPAITTEPSGNQRYEHPDGADDVIVSIEFVGGFMPMEAMFRQIPNLVATGDGRLFIPGPQIAIYPGPLLPNVQVGDIGEERLQALLRLADDHGLLAERVYESPTDIADAPDTVVTVRVGDETFVHRAYALGLGESESDEARAQLAAFVVAASAATVVDTVEFVPAAFRVRAFAVDDLTGFELEPTVIEWPVDQVELAAAGGCVIIDAAEVGELFAAADQLTFFEQGDVTYQLAAVPVFPGSGC